MTMINPSDKIERPRSFGDDGRGFNPVWTECAGGCGNKIHGSRIYCRDCRAQSEELREASRIDYGRRERS